MINKILLKASSAAVIAAAATGAHAGAIDYTVSGPLTDYVNLRGGNPTSSQVNEFTVPRYFDDLYVYHQTGGTRDIATFTGLPNNRSTYFKLTAANTGTLENPRSEIATRWEQQSKKDKRWYAASVYIPEGSSNFATIPQEFISLIQVHTVAATANNTLSPPISFGVRGEQVQVLLRGFHGDYNYNVADADVKLETLILGDLVRNQWYCLIVSADWTNKPGDGAMAIWLNKKLIYRGANTYNSYYNAGNYLKAGVYVPGSPGVGNWTVYTDVLHLATSPSGYTEQMTLDEIKSKMPCK